MRVPSILMLMLVPASAIAQSGEDAAHRADRSRTRALNSRSANGYASGRGPTRDADDYARARDAYRLRLDAWRRQVAACESGDDRACDPR